MNKLMQGFWERKVPQYLGTYFAVGFGLLQFAEFASKRYKLSEYLVDKYLLVWLVLMPAFTILVYFGGKLNPTTTENSLKWPKFFVIGNVFLAVILPIFLLNGDKLEQSALIELTNEDGKKVKAFVPSLNKVKTVACFKFENLTGDETQDWWGVAFSHLLGLNLDQRPEFYTNTVYDLNRYYDPLGLEIFSLPSVGMQRKISQKSRNDYFTRISYAFENDKFVFKGSLYDARDGKPIVNIKVINDDPYAAIDEIKQRISADIPDALKDFENQVNLPSSTLITSNNKSLQYLTESIISLSNNPTGLEEVLRLAKKSIELDPACALCHYNVASSLYGLGRTDEAISAVKDAIKYGTSLPGRMQFEPKEMLYYLTNKVDTYMKLQEIRRKMFPYEFKSYETLLPIYKANYGVDSAKVLIREAIDNGNLEKGLLALYGLQVENEEYDAAKETLDQLIEEFPNRDEDRMKYASIYEKQGRIDDAKEILLEEEILNPLDTRVQMKLAHLDFKNIDIAQATKRINEGLRQASSLTDSLSFLWSKGYYFQRSGEIDKAIKSFDEYEKLAVKLTPINRVIQSTFSTKIELYESINQSGKLIGLLAGVTKYSPESEEMYLCMINVNALERGYKLQLNVEEFSACHSVYQSFGDGYGEYADVMILYNSGDYAKCIEILEGGNERVSKLFTNKFFLARIYAKAGKVDRAKEILQKVIDQKTEEPMHYYEMAALFEKDDKQTAKKYLDIALRYWSNADADYIPLQWANDLADRLGLYVIDIH